MTSKATQAAGDWGPGIRTDEVNPSQRQTTISAHIVTALSVTMSTTEMDVLVRSLGKGYEELSPGERMVQAEFVAAVEAVRFG